MLLREALVEDEGFKSRSLAATICSKVYFYLGCSADALRLALLSDEWLSITDASLYKQTILCTHTLLLMLMLLLMLLLLLLLLLMLLLMLLLLLMLMRLLLLMLLILVVVVVVLLLLLLLLYISSKP